MASRRTGVIVGAFALAFAVLPSADRMVAAPAPDERTISFYHIHTKETLTVTYKRGGKFVPDALAKINWLMRDWRKNKAVPIDPNTIDLAWEMHEELGSKEPIHVICGHRSQDTNEMLRKTRGGQASQSQHITGRAIDITFPDVPLKRMRYSALVRERGGVGYYPTSGIPFVHIDTARVRAWPRLPRYELALLFPGGRTKHMPADGGPLTSNDVKVAQTKHKELAIQVAEYQQLRFSTNRRASIQIAAKLPGFGAPASKPAPAERAPVAVAAFAPATASRKLDLKVEKLPPAPRAFAPATVPRAQLASLQSEIREPLPRMLDRPSTFAAGTHASSAERGKLNRLVAEASQSPHLIVGPKPAVRPQKGLAAAAGIDRKAQAPTARVASLGPTVPVPTPAVTDMSPQEPGDGWVQAPEFDEDHPEELAYRPFPLAPLLTDTASAHAPELAGLQHPDVAATLDALDDVGGIVPMRFRPGRQVAQVMWAQQFEGKAVHLDALTEIERRVPTGLENRAVSLRTTAAN